MSGQQGGEDKNSMQILWIIAGIFILGAIIWWSFGEQLKYFFIKLRFAELYLVWLVVQFIPIETMRVDVYQALELSKTLPSSGLTADIAEYLSLVAGKYLRFPIILVLLYFAYKIYKSNIKMRYKKKYNMHSLANQEKTQWPQINAALGLDLVNQDLNSGPWAMTKPPIQFCKDHKLIKIHVEPPKTLGVGPRFITELNETRAEQVFGAQLGRLWQGPEKLAGYKRALFATFIARGCRDSDAAKKLIIQINSSCDSSKPGELDFTGADSLWKKHYNNRDVQDICQFHAYEFTIFTAAFLFARQDGVFPTSDFLWLKPVDRLFWYVLNNVGRQTPCPEAAGVHAHFLAEKSLQRSLSVPVVKEAVKALQDALDDIIYVPDREEKDELLKEASGG